MQELILTMSYVTSNHTRQDSCRGCGNEIQPLHFCSDCNQPYQFQCANCKLYIDEQIHFGCKNKGM